MKWIVGKEIESGWHRYFAWHPMQIEGRWVWLEWVKRKMGDHPYGQGRWIWQYCKRP